MHVSAEQSSRRAENVTLSSGAQPVPLRSSAPRAPAPPADEPTLTRYLWTILEGWRIAAGVVAAALAGAVTYLLTSTPIYHADAVVQVEPRNRGPAGLDEVLRQTGPTPAEAEIALIRSRSSLGEIVEELGLDLQVAPRRFPLVGSAIARRHQGTSPAPAPLGLSRFGWGGERLRIQSLDLPDELVGVPLRLVVREGGRYLLSTEDGAPVVEGTVGALASAGPEGRGVALLAPELVARPGTEFTVRKRRRAEVVAGLQRQLRVVEDGRLSGILVISLDGPDPGRTAAIVNAVATNYARQNVDRKAAEAAQQLAFLESQLPVVKANIAVAEAALNKFLKTHGAVNLSTESRSLVERAAVVERELSALELQASELRQRFTVNHPTFVSLNEKIHVLRSETAGINARLQQMPEAEADSARLQRDLRVATELYNLLLTKSQELRIVKSGTVGNVRIVDAAIVPERPAWPRTSSVLALSTLLGLLGGVGAAFAWRSLSQGARDPEDIEAGTGLPVYSAVPHSRREQELAGRRHGGGTGTTTVLASSDPRDPAVENLRSLRTSLQFALVEARNNVVLISGPAPGVGKSFVCVNLAAVLASGDRRVLIIDADLRRGCVHRFFGLDRRPGLGDVLGGAVAPSEAIRGTAVPGLDVMTSGSLPPNTAELLSTQRFQSLVESVSRSYALVLVDTPPVLAVTDATVVARLAGVNLLVLREGQHSNREIALCVKRFAQTGLAVQGAVLNDVRTTLGRYGKHGRYQRYEYDAQE